MILPHALAYNAAQAPEAMARIARALGRDDAAPRRVRTRRRGMARRPALKDIGMPADGLDRAADLAVTTPTRTRGRSNAARIRALLQRAFDGAAPQGLTFSPDTNEGDEHDPEPQNLRARRQRRRRAQRVAASRSPPTR